MFTRDSALLAGLTEPHRIWQGIPGIEITGAGRQYACWYTGGTGEEVGNAALLCRIGEDGACALIAAALPEPGHRCFDPCLWIDPIGRLWFVWARQPDDAFFAVICDDPDADEPVFSEERLIGRNIMLNKPTVLSSGEWLFPAAVWKTADEPADLPHLAYALATADQGETFVLRGGVDVPDRSFDEHMFLERRDSSLAVYVRTFYGIGMADSIDGGFHWSEARDSGFPGPSSRFFIRRLPDGRVLLINHLPDADGKIARSRLAAQLSEDDGLTFPYTLMLDERANVSYPDAAIAPDGSILVIYDRERGGEQHSFAEAAQNAREILVARITTDDIIAGEITSPGSYLRRVISRLGDYEGDPAPLYEQSRRNWAAVCAKQYAKVGAPDAVLTRVFEKEHYSIDEPSGVDSARVNALCEAYRRDPATETLFELIMLIRDGKRSEQA